MQEKVCIIIPCYNEQDNLAEVVKETSSCNKDATILVVNDCSSDATASVARSIPEIELIDLPCNLGVGGAVQTGFIYASRRDFNYAVKLDGDLQHPPEFISAMINELKTGKIDIIIGSRFIDKVGFQSSFTRRIGIKILKLWGKLLTGEDFTDPTSGFRAYNRKAIDFMARHYPSFDYPEPEEIVLAQKNGLIAREMAITMRPRKAGKSSISSSFSFYYMLKVSMAMFFIALRAPVKSKYGDEN